MNNQQRYYSHEGTYVKVGDFVTFRDQLMEVIINEFTNTMALDNAYGQIFLDSLTDAELDILCKRTN